MKKDAELKAAYAKQIQNLLEKNYAEKISQSILSGDHVWYLPHFGDTNPSKPGKLRLVFDAAARTRGTSLNDQLSSGLNYLNSLLGVLMRFRRKRIAFTADIKEMFLQIKI